jgi:tetratricopeptide (TPR) repeat protein
VADSRIDELRRRLEHDPGSRLFAQLAEEHRKAGDLAEAIRVARAGLALHPVYPSARLTLGRALLDSGEGAGARQELEQALRQAPDNILASRFLAQALLSLGDLEGALKQYSSTLKMAPGDPQLTAHVEELRARLEKLQSASQIPTGPMPRMTPPPLPASAPAGASGVAPTIRLSPLARGSGADRPAAAAPPAPEPAELGATTLGATTLPATPQPPRLQGASKAPEADRPPPLPSPPSAPPAPVADLPPPQTAVDRPAPAPSTTPAAAADDGVGAAPFSSSTLAELYLQQGMQERAVEVYKQVLAEDPDNHRARARLAALQAPVGPGSPAGPEDARAVRRRTIERTIAGLEALLGSLRRS